jgi:hypothetical protein
MELHPLISHLDKKDFERHINECKINLLDFLEDLGLSEDLTLHVFDSVWVQVLIDNSYIFMEHSDNQAILGAGLN